MANRYAASLIPNYVRYSAHLDKSASSSSYRLQLRRSLHLEIDRNTLGPHSQHGELQV